MTILLLATSQTFASGFYGGETIQSPWGDTSRYSAEGVCQSPKLKIGTVVSVKPFLKPIRNTQGKLIATDVYSKLLLQTERDLRGNPGASFVLYVVGGKYNGKWYPTSANAPQPVVGGRYLVGMAEFQSGGLPAAWPDGTNLVISTFSIKSDITLPSVSDINFELEAFCDKL